MQPYFVRCQDTSREQNRSKDRYDVVLVCLAVRVELSILVFRSTFGVEETVSSVQHSLVVQSSPWIRKMQCLSVRHKRPYESYLEVST